MGHACGDRLKDKLTRRRFGQIAGGAAFGASAGSQSVASQPGSTSRRSQSFPDGFVWGAATSAYQIEGAVDADGRGRSVWDDYAHTPGKIADGSNADRAADHYHRYKDDVQLMVALGIKAYRFSIAWPRVFPDGRGTPNPKGLDFYNRLVDELLANGIQPFATLYHWDMPSKLQTDLGGWESRDTAKAFADYAGYVASQLTDRVRHVFTINECSTFVDLGHADAPIEMAPGLKLPPARLAQVRHHVALAHGLSVQAIRAAGRAGTKVGPAENLVVCVPAIETEANIRAAEIATRELNAGYLTAIMEGRYTDGFLRYAGANAPKFTDADMKIISSPIDMLGLNVYMPQHYVQAGKDPGSFEMLPFPTSFPRMDSRWLMIGPEALYWAPRLVAKLWPNVDLYITENGTSAVDEPVANGDIYDLDRVMYLRNYLTHLQRATSEGVPVKGYFHWSLMDNFEWSDGLQKRFGLYKVDFETQVRRAKLSATYFRETIANNAVM